MTQPDTQELGGIYVEYHFCQNLLMIIQGEHQDTSYRVFILPCQISKSKLVFFNPRYNPCNDEHRRHEYGPQPDMQNRLIVCRLGRRTNCRQSQQEDDISTGPMILVDGFALVHASKDQLWSVELSEANKGLQKNQNIRHQAHDAMYAGKSCLRMGGFVDLNNGQARDEKSNSGEHESGVDIGPVDFLLLSSCRLEDEDGLRDKKDAG